MIERARAWELVAIFASASVLALALFAAAPAAVRAADPPASTTPEPTPVPTDTPPTPAPDPAPVPVRKKATPKTTSAVTRKASSTRRSTPVRSAPVVVRQAPRVTYSPPQVTHKTVKRKAKAVHRRHRQPPVISAVLGARHTIPAQPTPPVTVNVRMPKLNAAGGGSGLIEAFWIFALALPALMLLALFVPASVLPYELAVDWMNRRFAVALVAVTMLALDAALYALG